MTVQQISVFLENKAGRLAAAASVLKDNAVNIRALTIAESANYGVLRMIVNDPDKAMAVLKDAGFTAKQNPMIAVEIDDREGLLFDIVNLCDTEGINIEYTYSYVETASKKAILFLRFEDTGAAVRMFTGRGYKLLSPDEVCKI
ncbi:MAG: hypothetical protein FWC23_05825 [Chitinispirillia bacterium]|nr:hypothetical protein [Chitinispirillia bacterium]MCL2268686.1 hypothetical protein [Chitinispirillia bacterium]